MKKIMLMLLLTLTINTMHAMPKASAGQMILGGDELQKSIAKELNDFYWINEGDKELMLMGGMGIPFNSGVAHVLKCLNIGVVINLTGFPSYCAAGYKTNGIDEYSLFIEDRTPPTLEQIDEFIKKADEYMSQGKNVVVHCHGGRGRTGTMIACWLVAKKGMMPNDAIAEVRMRRPGSIETRSQEKIIKTFYDKIMALVVKK